MPTEFASGCEITCGEPTGEGTKTRTFSREFEFKWGNKFGGMNPCKYYKYTESMSNEQKTAMYTKAKEALSALQSLNTKTFKVIVTPALG